MIRLQILTALLLGGCATAPKHVCPVSPYTHRVTFVTPDAEAAELGWACVRDPNFERGIMCMDLREFLELARARSVRPSKDEQEL